MTGDEEVLVSVVVACFDAQDVLPDQLAALARQRDAGPWELVLADNGSRDATRAVAEAFARDHPRLAVRVVDASAHRGAGAARNAGVAASSGALLAFCDADDVVADDWLAQVRAGSAGHGFFAGRFEESRLNPAWLSAARGAGPEHGLQHADGPPWLPFAGAGNLVVRRELFEAVGGFDLRCPVLEDNDLCWRVQLATGEALAWWPAAVVHVRLRATLAGMWRQGLTYGASSTWLQARYAEVPAPPGAPAAPPRAPATRPWWRLQRPLGKAAAGSAAWRLGWRAGRVLGRRRLRRAAPPALRQEDLVGGS